MTEVEAAAALKRIEAIVERASTELVSEPFGADSAGLWDTAWAQLEEELKEAAEAMRAFARTADKQVGTVLTDWTGDMYCVWSAGVGAEARRQHLERFQQDFTGRVRVGYLLAAAVRTALTVSLLAAPPLTVLTAAQAARAAWDLVEEVQMLRASMDGASARDTNPVS